MEAMTRVVNDTTQALEKNSGSESIPGGPRTRDGERSRDAILEAAERLFAERGYLGISLDEIARRSGAKRSLILYHFKSKTGLWRAASSRAAARFNEAVRSKIEGLPEEGITQKRRAMVAAWFDVFVENPAFPKMLVLEGGAAGPRLDWLIENFGYEQDIAGTPILRERMTQSVLRDALMAIFLAMSALGPLMEASMSKVSGQPNAGLYPMSKQRREELIHVLMRILETFDDATVA